MNLANFSFSGQTEIKQITTAYTEKLSLDGTTRYQKANSVTYLSGVPLH